MSERPDPERDFKAASNRFQQAMADAAELPTEAEHLAAIDAAIENYNRAVDEYNAHVEEYNAEHGPSEVNVKTLRYLVRDGDTATLGTKPEATL